MHSSPARRAALATAPALLLALTALTACGSNDGTSVTVLGTAGPAGLSDSPGSSSAGGSPDATSATAISSSSSSSAPATSAGCAAGGGSVPDDAGVAKAGDLDGDGQADELWLADSGGQRMLGVRTAGGAVFSTEFTSSAPEAASAVGDRLDDGNAMILLDTGRSAALYAVVDCAIVETQNKDGRQYTFDLGFGGIGTGVACGRVGGKLILAGYNSTPVNGQDGTFTITRTRIDLSKQGARADNGGALELGTYQQDSATYTIANGVSCGDSETAHEPS